MGRIKILMSLFCLITTTLGSSEQGPQLRTEFGLVKGMFMQSEPNNRKFSAFLGLPFAEPPVGSLRFSAPKFPNVFYPPHEPLEATKYKGDCPQIELGTSEVKGSEDCLYLNVFTPDVHFDGSSSFPVMVWIHGGGFLIGSSDPSFYGPERFLNEDIVLVTFNYRLGPLGFLTNGAEKNPANIGILDQIKALQWVKHNIQMYGGDASKITIFGQSSGADSVVGLMSSPRAKDLFHQGIAMSGSYGMSNIFLHKSKPIAHYTSVLAVELGCDSSQSSAETIECLRKKPVEDILRQAQTFIRYNFLNNPFSPTPDGTAEHPVLPHSLDNLWNSRIDEFDMPLMIGGNKNDGIISYLDFLRDEELFGALNREFYREGPVLLLSADPLVAEKDESESATAKTLKNLYMGDANFTKDAREKIISMLTDVHFLSSIDKTVRDLIQVSKAPIYYYNYQYQGSFSLPMAFGHMEQIGVSNTDELFIMFRHEEVSRSWLGDLALQVENDIEVSKKMLNLWTEFAKNGNPTKDGSWAPVESSDNIKYAILDENEVRMDYPKDFEEKMRFVQSMLNKIYKHRNLNMKEHPILEKMEKERMSFMEREFKMFREEEEARAKMSEESYSEAPEMIRLEATTAAPPKKEASKKPEKPSKPAKPVEKPAAASSKPDSASKPAKSVDKEAASSKPEPALRVTLDSGIEVEVAEGDLLGAMTLLNDMEKETSEKVRLIREQMKKDQEEKFAEEVHQENLHIMRDEL